MLVVEDDADIRELIAYALGREGFETRAAGSGEEGLAALGAESFDLVLLDVMLPGADGLQILKKIKADPRHKHLPVIMSTAKSEDADIVAGLELGADDYITKPFSPRVLAARVRAALRRQTEARPSELEGELLRSHGLVVDEARHEVLDGEAPIELSATEFALLAFLMRSPGHVFSRSRIIDAVKGPDYPVTDRSVDVQMLSLRRKLGAKGELLETVRGIGYRFRDER